MVLAWALLMAAIGLFILVSALTRSEFIIYRLLVARASLLWKEDYAHRFLAVSGILIIIVAVVWAIVGLV